MIVIVHGYDGSGPGHWQRWLHDELCSRGAAVAFPELPAPTAPQKDQWVAALAAVVAAAPTPVTFVCHSLGCWAVDHWLAGATAPSVHAALLVAPPSPLLPFEPVESFLPPPRRRECWAPFVARTLVVGSDDDDYASAEEIAAVAHALGSACRIIPGAGHLNVASGYGPWPFALEWLRTVGAC
jgi:predicted alpha/beta hydrolase family esterase